MNKHKMVALLFVLLSGALLLYQQTFSQPLLSQGDHGRDLYAAWATLHGAIPYRDYWWVYGPLMPYYYAAMFKLLGISIHAILIGQCLLKLLSGVFIFLSLGLFIPEIIAFSATLWFWVFFPDFFFTYSHTGGITLLMAITYFLFRYIHQPAKKLLYLALGCSFLLCLVKLNFGAVAWLILLGFVFLIEYFRSALTAGEKKNFYLTAGMAFPAAVLLIYTVTLWGLPVYAIRQCLPYLGDDQPYNAPLTTTTSMLVNAIINNIFIGWPNFIFALLVGICGVQVIKFLCHESTPREKKFPIIATFILLVVFYILNLHEYLKSGVLYRVGWAMPFSLLLLFLTFGLGLVHKNRILHWLFAFAITAAILPLYQNQLLMAKSLKIPEQCFTSPQGGTVAGNQEEWFLTVKQTVAYLNANLKPGEKFFALPYDPLYYFLTQRLSPTRMLIFFDHIKIPPEQERSVIAELEKNNVQYVLISSRARFNTEYGLGTFGVTYCPLLAQYVQEHFQIVATFGDWVHTPGWGWDHGTQIYKRIK